MLCNRARQGEKGGKSFDCRDAYDIIVWFTLVLTMERSIAVDVSTISNILATAARRTDANAPFRNFSVATDRIAVYINSG